MTIGGRAISIASAVRPTGNLCNVSRRDVFAIDSTTINTTLVVVQNTSQRSDTLGQTGYFVNRIVAGEFTSNRRRNRNFRRGDLSIPACELIDSAFVRTVLRTEIGSLIEFTMIQGCQPIGQPSLRNAHPLAEVAVIGRKRYAQTLTCAGTAPISSATVIRKSQVRLTQRLRNVESATLNLLTSCVSFAVKRGSFIDFTSPNTVLMGV